MERGDLVAQSGDLGLLGGAGLKYRGKQSEQGNEDRTHCENDDDLTNDLTSIFSIRTEFSATTRPVAISYTTAPNASFRGGLDRAGHHGIKNGTA